MNKAWAVAPENRAIEENLAIFTDDAYFLRYLVKTVWQARPCISAAKAAANVSRPF